MTDLPEAPSSVTLSLITPKGFPALFTLRETTGTALINKIALLEKELEEKGYKPQSVRGSYQKKELEYVQGRTCPKCGSRLVVAFKKDGSKFFKCETNKYNKFTGQAEGCNYVDWNNPNNPAEEITTTPTQKKDPASVDDIPNFDENGEPF